VPNADVGFFPYVSQADLNLIGDELGIGITLEKYWGGACCEANLYNASIPFLSANDLQHRTRLEVGPLGTSVFHYD
jgi:hypothetical protein